MLNAVQCGVQRNGLVNVVVFQQIECVDVSHLRGNLECLRHCGRVRSSGEKVEDRGRMNTNLYGDNSAQSSKINDSHITLFC